jgi:IPT/TIG domain
MKTWLLSPVRLGLYCAIFCLSVVGCGGSGSSQNTSPPPVVQLAIQSITPSSVPAGSSSLTITITGSGFTTSSVVVVNNTQVTTVYVSATQLQATVAAGQLASGAQLQVAVTNGAGTTSSTTVTLSVDNPAPALLSLAPSTVTVGLSSATVTITGSGFVPTSIANFNGSARTTTFTSATQVIVSLTAADLAAASNATITVTNSAPGGGTSAGQPFSVVTPLPVITSVSPASLPAGSPSTTLDIVGTNFLPTTVVSLNNGTLASTFLSPTELNVMVPATSLAAGGTAAITVSNPDGSVSAPFNFQVVSPKPVLSSILPGNVATGSAATITLTGSGFEANSVVQWNGSARTTTFLSATSLQVALSAADLANSGTGKLMVTNPVPGGGTTAAATLNITSFPIPVIQGITLSTQSASGCSTIQATITGTNFVSGDSVQLNGFSFRSNFLFSTSPGTYQMSISLPAAAIKPGPLTFTVTNNFFPPVVSDPYTIPSSAPALVALCSTPAPANVYASTSFSVFLTASEINSTAVPNVSLGALPAGITLTSPASISIPPSGTTLSFSASSSVVPGTYSIPVTGQAGSLSVTGSIQLNVQTGATPNFLFAQPLFRELGVPIGGSNQIQFSSSASGSADYNISPSVSGLPPGTTATVSPSTIIPGQTVTVVVTAASTAPVSQNTTITLTGTPAAAVPPAQTTFLLDVTAPPGSLPGNRTDFVSTGETPYSLVYDRPLDLIFASNPSWNRIDIVSNKTHVLQQSIPVRGPRAIDVSQDGSTVWIGTNSQQIFAMNTTTFALTRYMVPAISAVFGGAWEDNQLLALADGTLLLNVSRNAGDGSSVNAVWTPGTNQLTVLPTTDFSWLRSGDGTKAFGITYASGYTAVMYSVATKAVTNLPLIGQGYSLVAVNQDGSRLVGGDNGLYDGSAQLIGKLPAYLGNISFPEYGPTVFSPDGTTLYQIASGGGYGSFIATIDVATLTLKGLAPALATLPNGVSETPVETTGLSVDNTGILIGIQGYGIGFDDSTFFQNFGTNSSQPGPPVALTPGAGPLSGGTVSSPYGAFDLTPDVWYGPNRGAASLATSNSLTITSPPGNADGPVNLKYIYPSGAQVFTPQAFSYSAYPQYSILSGASPNGGVPGRISGYGMPADASGGTLTIGGIPAPITTTIGQYPPYTGEAFPSTYLDYTIPPGNPGYADLAITTPIGNGALPKAIFYAKSVNDYSSGDTFTDVFYDATRQQVYLSAGDHIDVFSTVSNQWLAPLKPTTLGIHSQFRGLSLTPDGSQLLAANLLDNSLGVINPDAPSQTFAIAIPVAPSAGNGCTTGTFSVSALSGNRAFVTSGLPPGVGGCPENNTLYIANLQARTVAVAVSFQIPQAFDCAGTIMGPAGTTEVSADGSLAIVGTYEAGICLYSTVTNSFSVGHEGALDYIGVSMAGDGNIAAVGNAFGDPLGNMLGSVAHPSVLNPGITSTPYPLNNYPANTLLRPRLNATGSLYYWAFPKFFEIIDVPTGTLRLRFSLTETVQNVETPIAIDQGGRQIFLITDKGLTIVDLGSAPLSVGHLSLSTASAGTQIQVRGSGFKSGVIASVGGQPTPVNLIDEDTLTLTIPALSSGVKDLTLTNTDGSTYVLPSAITVP